MRSLVREWNVQLARANWQFNGSGTLTGAGVDTFGTWNGIMVETGNSGDKVFTVVATGANVPITSGPLFNDAVNNDEEWRTVPPL